MKTNTLKSLLKQAVNGVLRNSSVMSLIIIASCMFVLGIFMLFSVNLTNIGNQLSAQVGVNAYLEDDITDEEKSALFDQIIAMPEVKSIAYVSKEDALETLRQNPSYNSVLDILEYNPLPESYKVDLVDFTTVVEVASAIQDLEGIDEVQYGERYVENMVGFMRTVWILTLIVGAIAIFAISIIVGNTIKLTVYSRRKEIEIMKLVGATDTFIQLPFIFEGMILGLIGSIISVVLLLIGYNAVSNWAAKVISFVPLVFDFWTLAGVSIFMVLVGIAAGAISSLTSTRKHIKV